MGSRPVRDRGAALLVALVVAVVVVLVGTAHLLMTQTESGIASNETRAAEARHAARAAARAVKLWFEHPGSAPGFPPPDVVVRQREILDESDPYGSPLGSAGPQYKEGVDLDADGLDDLFAWPRRGDVVHALMGTERAPDVRIDDGAFLASLAETIFGDPQGSILPRIVRIDVYAPPYVRSGEGWRRRGTATVRAEVVLERVTGGVVRTLARRTARAVLAETPYGEELLAAVHSCGDASLSGEVGVGWGALAATGTVALPEGIGVPPGPPRSLPGPDGGDRLWTEDPAWVAAFSAALAPDTPMADPWLRVIAGEGIEGAPSADAQPWAGSPPPPPGTPPPWECCDRSNLFQHQTWLDCPGYDHGFWKSVARSGLRGARYFAWDPSEGFREDGAAAGRSAEEILVEADGEPSFWFFDTADGRAPRDDDDDGRPDNLTPELWLGPGWHGSGFLLVHAERIVLSGLDTAATVTLRAPAEPFVGAADGWVDLLYPDTPAAPFLPGPPGTWQDRGPPVTAGATFHGLLVTAGAFETHDGGLLYGAVVAGSVTLDGAVAPATRILWDASLRGSWPPEGWPIPRTLVTRMAVD